MNGNYLKDSNLVWHMQWDPFLEKRYCCVGVSILGGDMHESAAIFSAGWDRGFTFIHQEVNDSAVPSLSRDVDRHAIHLQRLINFRKFWWTLSTSIHLEDIKIIQKTNAGPECLVPCPWNSDWLSSGRDIWPSPRLPPTRQYAVECDPLPIN